MTFKVMAQACATCIYRDDSVFEIDHLESEIKGSHGYFESWRICHHSNDVCCRGFWNRHKDDFTEGQVAQRLDLVEFVEEGIYPEITQDAELYRKQPKPTRRPLCQRKAQASTKSP